MASDMLKSKSKRMAKMMKLREEGSLFYFRVDLKGSEDRKWDVTQDIMDLFEIDSISGSERLIFYVTEDPGDKIKELKKMKGVKKVKIY